MRVTLHYLGVSLEHFGVALGSVWRNFVVALGLLCGHCGVTLRILKLLLDYFQHMWVTLELLLFVFEKHSFFNDFMQLWGQFGPTLGPL